MWNEGEFDTLGNPGKETSSAYKFHKENFGKPSESENIWIKKKNQCQVIFLEVEIKNTKKYPQKI